MQIHLTMSKTGTANRCAPSTFLPRAQRNAAPAMLGRISHSFLEECLTHGREAALASTALEHRAAMEAIDIDRLPARDPRAYSPEVAIAYNMVTGEARVLPDVKDRGYPDLGPDWIYGTADVVGLTADAVIVLDYKSGWGDLTPASKHMQVRSLGLAFARAYQRPQAIVGLIRNFLEGGEPWWSLDTMDEVDLDAHAYELEALWRRLHEAAKAFARGEWDGSCEVGEHCARCDSFVFCPAQQLLARMVVRAGEGDIAPLTPGACSKLEEVGSHLNTANARYFLESVKKAKAVVEQLEELLNLFARQSPIPLDDGNVYGPRPWPTEKIDPDRARSIVVNGLQEEDPTTKETVVWCRPYGEAVYDASVSKTVELKKGDLDDALKSWAKRTPAAKWSVEKKALLEALRHAGASRVTYSYPVGKHRPKKEDA